MEFYRPPGLGEIIVWAAVTRAKLTGLIVKSKPGESWIKNTKIRKICTTA